MTSNQLKFVPFWQEKGEKMQKSVSASGTKSSTDFPKVETNIEYKLMST